VSRSDTTLQAETLLDRAFAGTAGAWDDDLVGLATDALALTGVGDCLAGFRRPGADLHLLLVSDRPSQANAAAQAAALAATVLAPAELRVSALVPTAGGCGSPAPDYAGLASMYQGQAFDLCAADWSEAFLEFASLPAGRDAVRYALAEVPVASTIEVYVEGVTSTSWSWDPAGNAVVFDHEETPALGAEITLRYVSAVACE
jgi:hypothetical protein